MKLVSMGAAELERNIKRARKCDFLDEMNLVVPWAELVALIAPHSPKPGTKDERPAFAVETMLWIHFLQKWFNLSDPAI
jgi:IS5 family transposase